MRSQFRPEFTRDIGGNPLGTAMPVWDCFRLPVTHARQTRARPGSVFGKNNLSGFRSLFVPQSVPLLHRGTLIFPFFHLHAQGIMTNRAWSAPAAAIA